MNAIIIVVTCVSVLNATMRRIDLICKLVAPVVAGVLLTHTGSLIPSLTDAMAGGFIATIAIGLWNVISFFGELSLLYAVYRLLPALKIKKFRSQAEKKKGKEDEGEEEQAGPEEEENTEVKPKKHSSAGFFGKLATPYVTLRNGWSIFWRQEINLVGFALASLYLTVLGFSGVTATYFLTQGVTSDLIGLFQGIGGILGIMGTLVYPFLQKKLGTVRAGMVGSVLQVSALVFSVIGVFVPGRPLADDSGGYYSVDCPVQSSPSHSYSSLFPSLTTSVSPSPTPSPTPLPTPSSSSGLPINLSVALVLVGVTGARFGLWMFDLAVSQLVQERVVEEERGVVSGVMNAMNSNMDMLHYVLVIVAPRPQHFSYLTLISFASVSMGMTLYLFYVRRAYKLGHFNSTCFRSTPKLNSNIQTTITNSAADDDDDDDDL